MKPALRPWRGTIYVGPRGGVFRGDPGDNAFHAHGAHQVAVGLEAPVTVHCDARSVQSRAVFVAATCAHRIDGGTMLSVYADVSSSLGVGMRAAAGGRAPVSSLSDRIGGRLAMVGSKAHELSSEVVAEIGAVFGSLTAYEQPDPALVRITRVLTDAIRRGETPSRAELAALAGLSEGRFSHWFRERTGMPMQTYRKWQRLTLAVEHILDGEPMVAAAHHAGFADQAHFVRTFRGMFGINPVAALGAREEP